ncbi:MAG: hypothetical protein K8S98_07875 [Planctomycetes bacterium]|nr:hypothetical protein [Planctomycetota bacterium]
MDRAANFPPWTERASTVGIEPAEADEIEGLGREPRARFAAAWSRRFAACAVLAAVLHLMLRTALTGAPAQVDEAPWLRWLRIVDEHPVRSALATALLAWSLSVGLSNGVVDAGENAPARS